MARVPIEVIWFERLLATPRQSIEIDELIAQCALQRRLVQNTPCLASIRVEGEVDRYQVEQLAQQQIVHLRKHELGDVVYLRSQEALYRFGPAELAEDG